MRFQKAFSKISLKEKVKIRKKRDIVCQTVIYKNKNHCHLGTDRTGMRAKAWRSQSKECFQSSLVEKSLWNPGYTIPAGDEWKVSISCRGKIERFA